MADPITIDCSNPCTVTVVHELSLPPLQLSSAEGAEVAFAIVGVWAVAFVIRTLVRLIWSSGVNQEES